MNELTVSEAAAMLGTSASTVRRMVDSGELMARRTAGGQRVIALDTVQAKKLQLENPGDPLGLRVGSKDESVPTGATERQAPSSEASGLTLEQVRRVALEWIAGMLPPESTGLEYPPITWTALSAERVRRHVLRWFEKHYREEWTRREVEDLAYAMVEAWAKEHPDDPTARPAPPPAPPEPTLADVRRELLEFERELLRDRPRRDVVK